MKHLYLAQAIIWMVVAGYFIYLYIIVFSHDKRKLVLRRFNNAIKRAYTLNSPPKVSEEILARLMLDYNSIVRHIGRIEYISCLDVLEQIYYRYDTYSDRDFKAIFKEERDENIRDFIFGLCTMMKEKGQYMEMPHKEAKIISNMRDALVQNNVALGTAAIDQLTAEIIRRDYELQNQKYDNQFGKKLSVVGIIVSLVFGVISIIMYLNPLPV